MTEHAKNCNISIGDKVETCDVYLNPIKGEVTAIHEHIFIVQDESYTMHCVPKRYYNIGFDKAKKQNQKHFVPARKRRT